MIKNAPYKESFYNFKLPTKNNTLLMYNSRTGALCSINEKTKDKVTSILNTFDNSIDEEIFNNLLSLGFIVPDDFDELLSIQNAYDKSRNNKNNLSFIMLPAEACNFSCPYCFTYEKRDMYMEEWVYESVYKNIEKKAIECTENNEPLHVGIAWFGGEPLLASDRIIKFMTSLKELKDKYKLIIDAGVVSNGYLLTLDIFKKLVDAGIYSYHISIDGDSTSHNLTRKLKTGQDTFNVIYQNFKDISAGMDSSIKFNFTIRINFLKNNVSKMNSFVKQLSDDFSSDKRFNLFFKPIYNIETSRSDVDSIASNICDNDNVFDLQRDLSYLALENNLCDFNNSNSFDPLPKPIFHWCETVQPYSNIVGADGSIFSCDTLMVDETNRAGTITKDGNIVLNDIGHMWKKSIFEDDNKVIKECMKCRVLPICMGGCKRSWLFSNHKPCHWTEEKVYNTMESYVNRITNKN